MKDKLRELAAECRKPYPEGAHGTRYADGYNDAGNDIADRLDSILNAEGDGGAVAWLHEVIADDGIADLALSFEPDSFPFADVAGYQSIKHSPLYTHPARSGVVSDEDAHAALMVFRKSGWEGGRSQPEVAMRAALEHFARRTP